MKVPPNAILGDWRPGVDSGSSRAARLRAHRIVRRVRWAPGEDVGGLMAFGICERAGGREAGGLSNFN